MLNVVALFGVLIILACAYGSVHPQALVSLVGRFANPAGLVFAVLVRVLMGVATILAAPVSRSPGFLYVIGSIALLAAVVLPLMGLARYQRLISWATSLKPAWLRVWLTFGLVFGAALIWASGII